MQHRSSVPAALLSGVLAAVLGLIAPAAAQAQGWGTVKGTLVWGPATVPTPEKANVNKDQAHCLAKGPILVEDYVINPKNKGIQNALVFLVDATDIKKPLPIHPSLKEVPAKPAEVDQPCCRFVPHVIGMREGQKLVVKNPAPVAHNFDIKGGALGPNENKLMPPGTNVTLEGIKARTLPVSYSCGIHSWMKGYVGVYNHPYFTVTDENGEFTIPKAPAGKYELVLWQEKKGFVFYNESTRKRGIPITIKADGTTDAGQLKFDPK